MPRTAVRATTPEGKAALASILKAKSTAWDSFITQRSPLDEVLTDALNRSEAKVKKQTPITAQEKLRGFDIMGFEPSPKQREIACDMHRVRVVRAGRRSGKTTLAAHEAVSVMIMKPGSNGWVVAPDYELAWRCWEIMVEELDKLVARGVTRYKVKRNSPDNMRIVLDNGSTCEGHSAENADDLQGVGLDWLVIDEIAQILPFVFSEMLFPALSDRGGWAFMIGTPIGENWTEKEFRKQKRNAEATGEELLWSEHLFETWHNTKMFPGGRNDKKIRDMERTMSFEEFMEQVCARPQKSRYVTYKEFDDEVHVRKCEFNPQLDVYLTIDPSTGVNPYAVAVLQDYGETVEMIDEFYRMSVLASDVIGILSEKPWWGNVIDAVIDDNWPQEREAWRRDPRVFFSVRRAHKSSFIEDSIPLVRKWLRDPTLYFQAVEPIKQAVLERLFPGKRWEDLDIDDQNQAMLEVDLQASDNKSLLFECAKLFVDRNCVNVIDEFTGYHYKQRKKNDQNPSETPTDFKNHLMDGLRYWFYRYKRFYGHGRPVNTNYLENSA